MSAPTLARPTTPLRPRPAVPSRVRVVAPDLRLSDIPAAAVLRTTSQHGPLSRDVIARTTGISTATVNRQVAALMAAGLVRERADLAASGAIGRPRVPVDVDTESFATIGVHIGSVSTGIVASDLRGRVLGGVTVATPTGEQNAALTSIAASVAAFAARWHSRRVLWVGVALGGRVDTTDGVVDHPRLGWRAAPVGRILGEGVGLPISVSPHVEAMAASELLLAPNPSDAASALYFYARETTGAALTIGGRVHSPAGGPGSTSHLPTGSSVVCSCGRTGCLDATVSDRALITAALDAGILTGSDERTMAAVMTRARGGSASAHALLVERAQVLGRTVALLHDLFNPERILLGGQAFSEYPEALPYVSRAFDGASTLPRTDMRVSGFGNRVQEYAAATVSLSPLFTDPLGAVRKTAA